MVDADTFVEGIELALGDLVDTISGKMLLTRKPWQSEKQHYRNVFIWSWPLFRLLLIVNNIPSLHGVFFASFIMLGTGEIGLQLQSSVPHQIILKKYNSDDWLYSMRFTPL